MASSGNLHGRVLAPEDHDVDALALLDDLGNVAVADGRGVDVVPVGRAFREGEDVALATAKERRRWSARAHDRVGEDERDQPCTAAPSFPTFPPPRLDAPSQTAGHTPQTRRSPIGPAPRR